MRTTAGAVAPVLYDILTLDATIGLEQVYIVHHSDCGGFIIDTAKVRASLVERAPGMKKEIEKASVPHYDEYVFTILFFSFFEGLSRLFASILERGDALSYPLLSFHFLPCHVIPSCIPFPGPNRRMQQTDTMLTPTFPTV